MAESVQPRAKSRLRKKRITDAAAQLFCRFGFHNVTVGMIASEVGITGSALYNHFQDKRQILWEAILRGISGLANGVSSADDDNRMAAVSSQLSAFAIDYRGFGLLLKRESRHLSASERLELNDLLRVQWRQIAEKIGKSRPGLNPSQSEFLGHCALAMSTSTSYHRVQLSPKDFTVLLEPTIRAILEMPFDAIIALNDDSGPKNLSIPPLLIHRVSRRQALLSVSTRMFAQTGYGAITIGDIGAVVGITGPSVYNHYATKADLLMAAMRRGAEWLQMGMEIALSRSETPAQALDSLIDSHIEFAINHSAILENLIGEAHHLPQDQQAEARAMQREYAAEWIRLLCIENPELPIDEARATILGLLAVINVVASTDRIVKDRPMRKALGQVGRTIVQAAAYKTDG